MLFSLVKKDFLLIKKYLVIFIVFAGGAPIFLNASSQNSVGILGFYATAIVLEYVLNTMVWQLEDKYKGSMLLCTTPYTRKALVEAKYLLVFIIFICNCIIYAITEFLVPAKAIRIDISEIGIAILIVAIFFDITIPALYKFGFVKLRNVMVMVIFIVPFVLSYIAKWIQSNNINLENAILLPNVVQNFGPYVLALAITVISMTLSIRIYSKKDL